MKPDPKSPRHPIRVVAQRTGLTPATIRAWERRYDAVTPARSEGGQRLYSDWDLDRLDTLRRLTEAGRSISFVVDLPQDEALQLLVEDRVAAATGPASGEGAAPADRVEEALASIRGFDADGLDRVLWRTVLSFGGPVFLDEVVGPLLRRVGEGWAEGDLSPAQEHLATEVVDEVLDRLVSATKPESEAAMVVATLPGERHGLGARLASTAAALKGWRVVYLGADLPVSEIAVAARGVGALAVAVSVVLTDDLDASLDAIARLRAELDASVALLVGGGGAQAFDRASMPRGVRVHHDLHGVPAPADLRRIPAED